MNVITTPFRDLLVLEPKLFQDDRGHFFESYNERTFRELGLNFTFVQDNQSLSRKGVLRGLHFQAPPHAQTKLVRVLRGVVQDVVVDLRKAEPTFGRHFSIELSAENREQLVVPRGFAHGFLVLSDTAEVLYKSDAFYNPAAERGIRYDDPALGINWMVGDMVHMSVKDQVNPLFSESIKDLSF
ncbi:MAG: dTDP-4-dehydrorhamnose 3,5-epimerase [Cyclobacteriaceae bacterium]|jgi:dTDP-4-dehydrorhamnose 3,5-epimerase